MNTKSRIHSFSGKNKRSIASSFRAPKKENKFKKTLIVFSIILFLLIIASLSLVFSNIFHIKEIEIQGLKDNDNYFKIETIVYSEIEKKKLIFNQKNLVFLNKLSLINNLDSFNFSKINIKKDFWKAKLIIEVTERELSCIFFQEDTYYFLDKDANIIKSKKDCLLTESDKNDNCIIIDEEFRSFNFYPIIKNIGNNRLDQNKKSVNLSSEYLALAVNLYNDLEEKSDLGLKDIILDEEYNTIKIGLYNGTEVYFSLKNDYSEQVLNFFTLKREKEKELNSAKYIDLRYGDKIFYY